MLGFSAKTRAGRAGAENLSIKKGLPPPTLLELMHHGRRGSEGDHAELKLQHLKIARQNCLLFLHKNKKCTITKPDEQLYTSMPDCLCCKNQSKCLHESSTENLHQGRVIPQVERSIAREIAKVVARE